MDISYDKEADAMYIGIRKAAFARNQRIGDGTILDLDAEGNIIGIEILDASKRVPKESLVKARVAQ